MKYHHSLLLWHDIIAIIIIISLLRLEKQVMICEDSLNEQVFFSKRRMGLDY